MTLKRTATALLAFSLAAMLTIPVALLADAAPLTPGAPEQASEEADGAAAYREPGNCTAYIRYYENPWEDVPGLTPDENGRFLLGTRVVSGLHEGDVLNAWDYVEDIPGHTFFDGWPLNLTICANPADNVMELCYFNRYDSEYTVNYYLMTGADLTADNWTGALAPESVRFRKMGSETFQNQRFNKLVEGEAYEYKLDGMYVVDSYPPQISLGTEPDDNVINVLYTTAVDNTPLDREVAEQPEAAEPPSDADGDAPDASDTDAPDADTPDADMPDADTPDADVPDTDTPEAGEPDGDAPDTTTPDTTAPDEDVSDAAAPEATAPDGSDASEPEPVIGESTEAPGAGAPESDQTQMPNLPSDTTMTEDELLSVLPDAAQADPELIRDFIGDRSNTPGRPLTQTGDELPRAISGLVLIALASLGVILIASFWRRSGYRECS